MREISLDEKPAQLPINTFLTYGPSGTGKTRWAASFPRPLFLSDATEQGWETIKYMDEAEFFEAGVKPIVWGVEQMNDMAICIERAKPLIAVKRVLTVVVDSISFYSDLYLNYLFALQTKQDNRAAYGQLGTHLRDLRVKLHGLGVNVVWLALVRNPEENDPTGGPQIPGQQGGKFMAGTNFVFYTRVEQKKEGGKVVSRTHEIRTMDYGPYIARNRLGGQGLPDPFIGTYTDLLAARGLDPVVIKKALPAAGAMPIAQGSVAAPIAKPTVVIAKPTTPKIVTVPPANNSAPKPAIPPQGTAHKGR